MPLAQHARTEETISEGGKAFDRFRHARVAIVQHDSDGLGANEATASHDELGVAPPAGVELEGDFAIELNFPKSA